MFPQKNRLRRQEVETLHRRGRRIHAGSFVVWLLPGTAESWRAAVIVGKKVERLAVRRNKIRRVFRAALAAELKEKPSFPALDFALWVRPEVAEKEISFAELREEIGEALEKMARQSC